MPTWTRVCCAVDMSEPSRVALREAAGLTRIFGGELTLLHVFAPPHVENDMLAAAPEDVTRRIAAELEAELAPWKEEASRLAERPVSVAVVPGSPAHEIVRFARERGFDLVVVATHGRTGVRRLVLGSVAEHVVRDSTVPVLVAKPVPEAGD